MINDKVKKKNVMFLGKEYEFPVDIIEYIETLDLVGSVRYELTEKFIKRLEDAEARYIFTCDMIDDMKNAASVFIEKLCEKKIYDRTIDEYVLDNKGYKIIDQVNEDAKKHICRIIDEEIENISMGVANANEVASSKIEGTGMRVFTRDLLGTAIYCAMEASALKSQERQARKLYDSMVDDIYEEGSERMGTRKEEYITDIYLPDMEYAIGIFVCDLVDKYLNDLFAERKMSKEVLEYINIKKSSSLLDNLSLTDDINHIFECAFLECPFNIDVYKKLIEYDMFNEEIYSTAKYFKLKFELKWYLERRIKSIIINKSFTEDMNNIKKYVKMLAMCVNENEDTLLKVYSNTFYEHIKEAYANLYKILMDDERCEDILDEISHEKILEDGEKVILEKSEELVNGIINSEDFLTLEKIYGFNVILGDMINEDNEDLKDKKDIDNYFIEKIFEKLGSFLDERKKAALEYFEELDKKIKLSEKRNEYAKSIRPKVGIIVRIVLCIVLALPIIIHIFLISSWERALKNYIEEGIEKSIATESNNEESMLCETELTGNYKVENIDYYYVDYEGITVVPYIRLYSNKKKIYDQTIYGIDREIERYYFNGDLDLPYYVEDGENLHFIPVVTIEGKDGSSDVEQALFDDFEGMRTSVYISVTKSVIYVIYFTVILIGYYLKEGSIIDYIVNYMSSKQIKE